MTDGEVVEVPRLVVNANNTINGQNLGILGGAIVAFVVSTNFPLSVVAASFQAAIAIGARLGWQVRGGGHNNTTHTTQHCHEQARQDSFGFAACVCFTPSPHLSVMLANARRRRHVGVRVCDQGEPPAQLAQAAQRAVHAAHQHAVSVRLARAPSHANCIKTKTNATVFAGAGVVICAMVLAQQGW